MTELDNAGADASVDESALFDAVVSGKELPEPTPVAEQVETPRPAPKVEPEANVPSSRLREEADARRKAERELDQWKARYEEATRTQRQPEQPQPKPDMFENPSAWVQSEVSGDFNVLRQQLYMQDRRLSVAEHGKDKVEAAQAKFDELLNSGALDQATVAKVMNSLSPFSEAVSWYSQYQTLQEVGTDPAAYKAKILEEAMKDQAYVAKILELARQSAPKVGGAATPAPTLPSLGRVGAATADNAEPLSDGELFAKMTARKKR